MDGPRYLLVGAAGLVGSHLRAALAGRDLVATTHRVPVAGSIRLDLVDHDAIVRVAREVRPDVIIVAGAEAWVERCEREPEATRQVNVEGPRRLADAAPEALLVVFSSEYVFEGRRGAYREEDPVAPINEYGRQKVALERIARERPRHLVCRVSGVFGWSESRTNFVAQLVDRLRDGERFRVPSDQLITPTPAPDLARAVVTLAESGTVGTFHVAGPEICERLDFARRAAHAFALDEELVEGVETASLQLAAARPLRAGLLTGRLEAALGRGLAAIDEALAAMRAAEVRR